MSLLIEMNKHAGFLGCFAHVGGEQSRQTAAHNPVCAAKDIVILEIWSVAAPLGRSSVGVS
ncbi:hypothetical protein [Saccharopolyspora elongata]|uniref:Uncharacterized protein n=1 Tax=Saccharopolyspora elongata TaxID=2530387 RepID=A0A4R4XUK4_9PSEU|nr:hypothetical protein [Saccharopolyspora elongata]TDD34282.1 hypothetical protein E1288_44655 [Saccharopolyspora elongata]